VLNSSGFNSQQGQEFFLLAKMSSLALRRTQFTVHWALEGFSPEGEIAGAVI